MQRRLCIRVAFIAALGLSTAVCAGGGVITKHEINRFPLLTFPDILTVYGSTNLQNDKQETLDYYLRSQTKTFDRYMAAKVVGVDISALDAEAVSEIQMRAGQLAGEVFRTQILVGLPKYNASLGGFPLSEDGYCVIYPNDDVKTTVTKTAFGSMAGAAKDYGFLKAEVCLNTAEWVFPVTQEEAVEVVQAIGLDNTKRGLSVLLEFTVDSCKKIAPKIIGEGDFIRCSATVRQVLGPKPPSSILTVRYIKSK